jgi:hypothetical protein
MFSDKFFIGFGRLETGMPGKGHPSTTTRSTSVCTGFLMAVVVQVLVIVSALLCFAIEKVQPFIQSMVGSHSDHRHASPFEFDPVKLHPVRACPRVANPVGIEVFVQDEDGENVSHGASFDDVTYVTTSPACVDLPDPTTPLIVIPESENMPPVSIRIQVGEDGKISTKFSYEPAQQSKLQLLRKFGMDVIPIKLTGNINILTDTVQICNSKLVSFKSIMRC